MTNDSKIRLQAKNALEFLRDHPAISPEVFSDSLCEGLCFGMDQCCKRGVFKSSKNSVSVYRDTKGWKKFKNKFEKEYKDDSETPKDLQSIYVTYKELYGEPWAFDHMSYWYELTFFVFIGNPYDKREYADFKKWDRYGGSYGGSKTFEGMLINASRRVRKVYGSFQKYDKKLYLPEELNNNNKESPFERSNGSQSCFSMPIKDNPNYIDVNNGLLNLRWLQWFMATDYCKKHWSFEMERFRSLVDKIETMMPEERRKLLEKYQ